jgi:hypothetical protein
MAKEVYEHIRNKNISSAKRAIARLEGNKDLADVYSSEVKENEIRIKASKDMVLKLFSEKELEDALVRIEGEELDKGI